MGDDKYISSIPVSAICKDAGLPGKRANSRITRNYYVKGELIGKRTFRGKSELLEHECSYKNGLLHGFEYYWHRNGQLNAKILYVEGREHGDAFIWGPRGDLLGTYHMEHGTGLQLWWNEFDGKAQLTVARQMVEGRQNGFEFWFQWHRPGVLQKESWWKNGVMHGIQRQWDDDDLISDYPKYWINGREVMFDDFILFFGEDTAISTFLPFNYDPKRVLPDQITSIAGI